MCFKIDKRIKAGTRTEAYKVLFLMSDGAFRGYFYNTKFTLGKTKRVFSRKHPHVPSHYDGYSRQGLYVYRDLQVARDFADKWDHRLRPLRVVKCTVDPKDFLHGGEGPYGAELTYRAIRPVEIISG